MEKRKMKILIGKAGGNASTNAKNYKITIPTTWAKELEITEENRDVEVEFDGKEIKIKKL